MHRIVKRKDFLAAASGLRANSGPLLLQGRDRADDTAPRIGLTVTKKHGNAVERNRIRRRLRAAVRDALPRAGKDGFDYVIVARRAALGTPFADLVKDIERGIARLHSGRRPPKPAPRDSAAQLPARADGDTLP
ncbi:ribonuclease P protein component [Ancylobacter novellus DSM 506]|uniref:Ribonuclease P protein component n=1 Tax=Ancylobacter novellus (strain ATCC 8093 / DSM 506 / JCM 20403 / CCM 1077 / IAM 12100 / NBRC 12443 / NCIMB 10456) TaxID=639283 RepID=D7A2X4_ANCN5|nr:ribonuclease P protein component [Ancylobacter novellus]ADH87692.1 ribonuclease P protein component [Ancylobacter novellus DSM 506]